MVDIGSTSVVKTSPVGTMTGLNRNYPSSKLTFPSRGCVNRSVCVAPPVCQRRSESCCCVAQGRWSRCFVGGQSPAPPSTCQRQHNLSCSRSQQTHVAHEVGFIFTFSAIF